MKRFLPLLFVLLACTKPEPHKLGANVPSSQTVPAWWIDGANSSGCASDTNTGQSATCTANTNIGPLLTYAQLASRWGTNSPQLSQATIITFLSSSIATDVVVLDPYLHAPNGSIVVAGIGTQIGSGTFTAVTPMNRATPQLLNANLGQTPTPFVGQQLVDTTRSGWTWVDSVVTGNVVALSHPFALAYALPTTFSQRPAEIDTFTAGDAYQVWQPPSVPLVDFRPTSDSLLRDNSQAYVVNIHIPDPTAVGTHASYFETAGYMAHVSSDRIVTQAADRMTPEPGWIINCWLNAGANSATESSEVATIIGGSLNASGVYATNGPYVYDGDVLLHGFVAAQPPINDFCGAYVDNFVLMAGVVRVFPNTYATGILWGPGVAMLYLGANVQFTQPMTSTFLLTGGLTFNNVTTAATYDTTGDPWVWHGGRTLNVTNLEKSVAQGGFGGNAVDPAQGISLITP